MYSLQLIIKSIVFVFQNLDSSCNTFCASFPIKIAEHQLIELGDTVWSFGGATTNPIDSVYRLVKANGKCGYQWKTVGTMLSPRSGFRIAKNPLENSILLIGGGVLKFILIFFSRIFQKILLKLHNKGSLKNLNKATELWIFISSWSPTIKR